MKTDLDDFEYNDIQTMEPRDDKLTDSWSVPLRASRQRVTPSV